MVLSRVLAEQWVYGFFGAVLTHSVWWPAAAHQVLWFTWTWIYVHYIDPFEGQIYVHTLHTAMLWIGAVTGAAFVRLFRTPHFFDTNFNKSLALNIFLVGAFLVGSGGYAIMSLAGGFTNPPILSESTRTAIAIGFIAAGVIVIILTLKPIFWRNSALDYNYVSVKSYVGYENLSSLKYMVLLVSLPFGISVLLDENIFLLILFSVLIFALALLLSIFVLSRKDAHFVTSKRRTVDLIKFWSWLFVFYLPIYIMGNLSTYCFQGAANENTDPQCTLAKDVETVFTVLASISAGYFIILLILRCFYSKRRKLPFLLSIASTHDINTNINNCNNKATVRSAKRGV